MLRAGQATAGEITSVISTLNIAFLTQSSAFVSSSGCKQPDEWHGGVWGRGLGGQFDVSANSRTNGTTGTLTSSGTTRNEFGGYQFGGDMERCNWGGSGFNVHMGLTGGSLFADTHDRAGGSAANIDIPFVGGYVTLTGNGFFAELAVRGDFYNIRLTDVNLGVFGQQLDGRGISVSSSAGYQVNLGSIFVEPSATLIWSSVDIDPLRGIGGPTGIPAGTFRFGDVDSLLGRAGLRIGTSFQATPNLGLQPFVAASVWHEFNGDVNSTFLCTVSAACGGTSILVQTSRIGTFGQFSLGIAAQILDTGLLSYFRVDYRKGEFVEGTALNGGLRWNF